jgi:transposase
MALESEVETALRANHPKHDVRASPRRASPRFKHKPGPKRLSFSPPYEEYSDPRRDLEYEPEWSTRDVAFYFGVSAEAVRQWVKRGHLTPKRSERRTNVFSSHDARKAGREISRRTNAAPGMRANVLPKHHDKYVSCQTAATAVGVSPSTVRSWISRGRLQATPAPDGRVTVRVGDVFALARTSRYRHQT